MKLKIDQEVLEQLLSWSHSVGMETANRENKLRLIIEKTQKAAETEFQRGIDWEKARAKRENQGNIIPADQ